MGSISGFAPSQSGLRYPNSWPNVPDLQIPTPFGPLNIGNAANGLCGGMSFAVADLWGRGRELPPPSGQNPQPNSPAFNYIVGRLFDSFNIPAGVAQYYEWMNLPTHDTWLGPHGTSWRTINDSMPLLRASVDAGQPCPLGLVCIHSANPGDLGHNHQVLAYGYQDSGSTTTVHVYDPNWPDRDDVTIEFDHTNPAHTTAFNYSTGDHTVLGFFTVPYAPRDPSPLYLGSSHWQQRPGAAKDVGVGADGSVWVIGVNAVGGGFGIYRWNGTNWTGIDGGAVRIAVAPDGAPWVVNDAGGIFQRTGSNWQQRPGAAKDIGVGADGSVWVIGTNAVNGGFGIYEWSGHDWTPNDGGAEQISVDPQGLPWVVTTAAASTSGGKHSARVSRRCGWRWAPHNRRPAATARGDRRT